MEGFENCWYNKNPLLKWNLSEADTLQGTRAVISKCSIDSDQLCSALQFAKAKRWIFRCALCQHESKNHSTCYTCSGTCKRSCKRRQRTTKPSQTGCSQNVDRLELETLSWTLSLLQAMSIHIWPNGEGVGFGCQGPTGLSKSRVGLTVKVKPPENPRRPPQRQNRSF